MTIKEFIEALKPKAIENYSRWGILPSITIGQALLESSKDGVPGGSGLTRQANNLFGIKGTGTAGSIELPTKEQDENGREYTVLQTFRAYHSWNESLDDYGQLLGTADRYAPVRNANDYKSAVNALQSSGYATDKSYSTKLSNTILSNKLYELDAQVGAEVPKGDGTGFDLNPFNNEGGLLDWKGTVGNWLMKAGFVAVGTVVLVIALLLLFNGDKEQVIKEIAKEVV